MQGSTAAAAVHVDWTPPPGRTDWLFGTGATKQERSLVFAVAGTVAAAAAAQALADAAPWTWWQWLLAAVLCVDVAGGVAANALGTAKRLYHGPLPEDADRLRALLHRPVVFAAAHVHPFIVAAAFPGASWAWAAAWYAATVAGVAATGLVPQYLQRAVALGWTALTLSTAPLVATPPGLDWFGPLLVLKLVVAHAVREEPYRPAPHPSRDGVENGGL